MTGHNVTVEDSSPLVVFDNLTQWADSPRSDPNYAAYSGPSQSFNSFHVTNVSASVSLPFNGTAIYLYGSKGPTHGDFTVALTANNTLQPGSLPPSLENPPEIVNGTGRQGGNLFQQLLFSRTGLDQSVPHLINVTNSGDGQFILDYFVVESEVGPPDASVNEITVDDAHPAFTYPVGAWDTDLSSLKKSSSGLTFLQLLNNETEHATNDIGAQASLTFRGSGVALHGTWNYGSFFARIDNRASVPVTRSLTSGLYNRPRELLFSADGLDDGMHTVTITNSEAAFVSIDYAVVSTTDPKNLDGVTPPSASSGDPGNNAPADPSTGKSTDLAPIIGGAVGGVVFLALVAVGIWLWRHKRRRRAQERVDLIDDEDTASVRQANSWVPWQLASTDGGDSDGHLNGTPGMSPVQHNESVSALASSQTFSQYPSSSAEPAAVAAMTSESHGFAQLAAAPITVSTNDARGPHSEKRRRVPEQAPQQVPRHEADAGVTLQRAETVTSTLPPLYDARWGQGIEAHA